MPVTCAECGLHFTSKKTLISHLETHSNKTLENSDCNQEGVKCAECSLTFSYKGNLIRHIKTVHSNEYSADGTACWLCGAVYSCKANVVRHVKRKHPDSSIPEKNYKHCCSQCTRRFNHLYNLKFHMRKAHNLGLVEPAKHRCPLCSEFIPGSMKLILNHFIDIHGVNIVKQEKEFSSFKKFINWKERIELETSARYVRFARRGDLRDEYRCHRSGIFISKSKGLRKLKSKGSRKIDGVCPANITLYKKNRNMYHVVFVETHVGHENDLKHLWLTEKDRLSIASRIACKVPFDVILEEVRNSSSNTSLERKHLITKKDLYNIQAMYNLGNKRGDEDVSIDSWVVETASTNNSCILFYKTQGIKSQYHNLNVKDFVLILMNDLQSEILICFARQTICLDRTHCLNKHGFELITIYILNENNAFPCILIVTNRTEKADFVFIFNLIKQQVGRLEPNLITSDVDGSMYDAWCQVMGSPKHHTFSPWHVDWFFRRNLIRIKNKDKQIAVYKTLFNFLEDKDIHDFESKLELIVNSLEVDPDIQDFHRLFKEKFVTSKANWAYGHLVNCGFQNYTNLELLHKAIKYLYLNKTNVRHVDKAISGIMKHIRDRHMDKFVDLEDIDNKTREISVRHNDAASQFSCARIMEHENTWKVDFPGIPDCEIFTVNEILSSCSCSLLCGPCGSCLHRFSCTCSDSCLKWNMCKHIHLVCSYLNTNKNHTDSIIYYDYINLQNQQTVSINQQFNNVINIPPPINFISSNYSNDINSHITSINPNLTCGMNSVPNLANCFNHTVNSETSGEANPILEITNEISTSNNAINSLTNSTANVQSLLPPPETIDQLSNMDTLIETLDQRRTVLSRKILDLLEYVENVESVEMVDAIEKLLIPVESTLATLKRL